MNSRDVLWGSLDKKKKKVDKNEKKRLIITRGQCRKSSKSRACLLFLAGPTTQQTQSLSLHPDAAQGPPAERRPIRKRPGGPVALFNIQERHLVRGGSARLERRVSGPPHGPHPGLISTGIERSKGGREEEYCGKTMSERYDKWEKGEMRLRNGLMNDDDIVVNFA